MNYLRYYMYLLHTLNSKHRFDGKRTDTFVIIIFGGYYFLMSTPYNLNFRLFELRSLVPRTWNLQDLTVGMAVP